MGLKAITCLYFLALLFFTVLALAQFYNLSKRLLLLSSSSGILTFKCLKYLESSEETVSGSDADEQETCH